jgi:hypothetical protein
MKNKAEIHKFKLQLEYFGITMSLDQEIRSDGKRLENYIFECDNDQVKIIEAIINRDFGRTKEIISDVNFYEEWFDYLIKRFKR